VYCGHIGVGLGSWSFRRTIPLWLLLIAAQLPDWLDAGFCLANHDRGPFALYTHGLVPVAATSIALGAVYALWSRDWLGALLVAAVAMSHYPLDYLTGQKPTWAGGPIIGLGLYGRPMADVVVEGGIIVAGWLLYRRTLPRETRNDGMVYASLFALLALQILAGLAFALNLGNHVKC